MLSQKIHTYTQLKIGRLYGSTYEPKRNMENSVSQETEALSEVSELEDWENFLCNAFSVLCRSSCVQLFATPWMVAHQAPLSMGFPRQEYWSELPFSSPGNLPDPGMNSGLLHCRQILYHLSYREDPMMGLVACLKKLAHTEERPYEDLARRWLVSSQEVSSPQEVNLLAP